jgi:hypothetical protein
MPAAKTPGERLLLELEPVAREAVNAALDAERAKLTDWERDHLVFGANLGPNWAVYDWYLPAYTQRDARVIVRASIGRESGEAVVETHPAPGSRPKRRLFMIGDSFVAPVIAAAFCVALGALSIRFRQEVWPSFHSLVPLALFSWVAWQVVVLLFVYNIYSSIPIRLPDGKLLFVNRARLKRGVRRLA